MPTQFPEAESETYLQGGVNMQSKREERAKRWAKLLLTFLSGQSLVQAISLVTGFLLIRWMSVESYAQYSVANAFQGSISMLVDLGFTGSIISMVGQRIDQPAVIGGYIRVARTYRGRMFFVLSAVSIVAFPIVVKNQPWPLHVKLLLLGSILGSVFFSAWSVYGAPLVIHRRLRELYQAQVVPGLLRLVCFGLVHVLIGIGGWLSSWINTIFTILTGWMMRKASRNAISEPHVADPEMGREMRKFLAPQWLGSVLLAIQSQITISLAAWFSNDTTVASLGVYGRIGQIFAVITAAGNIFFTPLAARSAPKQVIPRLFGVIGLGIATAITILALGFLVPGFFQFLVGHKYQIQPTELLLFLATTGVSVISGWLFAFTFGRKWVYFTSQIVGWIVIISVQVAFLAFYPLTSTERALEFNLVTYSTGLIGLFLGAVLGLRNEKKNPQIESETVDVAQNLQEDCVDS